MFFQGRSVSIHSHIFFGTHHWIKNYLIRIAQLTFTDTKLRVRELERDCPCRSKIFGVGQAHYAEGYRRLCLRVSKFQIQVYYVSNVYVIDSQLPVRSNSKEKKSRFVTLLNAHYFRNYRVKNLLLHNILNKNSFWLCNLLILHFRRILT